MRKILPFIFNWIPIFAFLPIAFNQIMLHLVYLLLSLSPPHYTTVVSTRTRELAKFPHGAKGEQGEWKSTKQRFQHPMWTNCSAATGPAGRLDPNETSPPRLPTRAEGDRRSHGFDGTVPPDHVIRLIASGFAWCFQYYLYGHASQMMVFGPFNPWWLEEWFPRLLKVQWTYVFHFVGFSLIIVFYPGCVRWKEVPSSDKTVWPG